MGSDNSSEINDLRQQLSNQREYFEKQSENQRKDFQKLWNQMKNQLNKDLI